MYYVKLIGGPVQGCRLQFINAPIEIELPVYEDHGDQIHSPIYLTKYQRRLIIGDEENKFAYYAWIGDN